MMRPLKLLEYYFEYWKKVLKQIRFQIWLRSKGVHGGFPIKKSFFKIKPRIGDPDKFRQAMLRHAKKTREFQVLEGADEPLPVTKIAGKPWWPEGIQRPICRFGHKMNFIAQILLSDVPISNMPQNSLLSFHYCDQCTSDGKMSYGWYDKENRGYDLSIFDNIDNQATDTKGIVASSLTKSYSISFRDIEEVPGGLCEDTDIDTVDQPKDFPQGKDDFDENIYLGLKHVSKSKIGGWPSWEQYPEWPVNEDGNKYEFLGQFDWRLFVGAPWSCGGYAYLFITQDKNGKYKAEMVIQVT
jgi:uncharacterized protein YwqG